MEIVFEFHKYQQYDFHYIFATTNKYFETKLKEDVDYTYGTVLKETGSWQVFYCLRYSILQIMECI
jgi:hypothetical protein